jgi:hypothetical protein
VAYLLAVGSRATRLRSVPRFSERSGLETAALRGENNRITQRGHCQVLRLPTERRISNSRGSLRIVSGLAVNTHSIFCGGPQGSETVNGCPVLRRQEPSPRGTRASCRFCQSSPCALLRSAPQENLFLLDKDLHGCRLYENWLSEPLSEHFAVVAQAGTQTA